MSTSIKAEREGIEVREEVGFPDSFLMNFDIR